MSAREERMTPDLAERLASRLKALLQRIGRVEELLAEHPLPTVEERLAVLEQGALRP